MNFTSIISGLKANLTTILLVIVAVFTITTCRARDAAIAASAIYKTQLDTANAHIKADVAKQLVDSAKAAQLRDSLHKIVTVATKKDSSVEKTALASARPVVIHDTTFVRDSLGKDSVAKIDSATVEMVPLSQLNATITANHSVEEALRAAMAGDSVMFRQQISDLKQEITDRTGKEKTQSTQIDQLEKNQKWVVGKGILIGAVLLKGVELLLGKK